jgi:hypothetical protein
MRDIPVEIKLTGLSPIENIGPMQVINLKMQSGYLQAVLAPRILTDLSCQWPFPQLFKLGDTVYVATIDAIYKYEDAILIPMITNLDNAGYPWDASIIGDFCVFVNNKVVVAGTKDELTVNNAIPSAISICNVGDQLILGAPWAYGAWNNQAVLWGSVGSTLFTIDRSNVAALRFADCGTVLRLIYQEKKTMTGLKPGFVALGTDGVTSFLADDLPAVYSKKKIASIGIHSQCAAALTQNGIFYVGTDGSLNVIKDAESKSIDYHHLFRAARGEVVLTYNEVNDELYIGI